MRNYLAHPLEYLARLGVQGAHRLEQGFSAYLRQEAQHAQDAHVAGNEHEEGK